MGPKVVVKSLGDKGDLVGAEVGEELGEFVGE